MKRIFYTRIFFYTFLFIQLIHGHGFGHSTVVRLHDSWCDIQQISLQSKKNQQAVLSYNVNSKTICPQKVLSAAQSTTNCYIKLCFDEVMHDDILCTPTQEFYLPAHNQWIPAYELKVGDKLLCSERHSKSITHIELVKSPLKVYSIEIENTHTFFVGNHSILTHNMILPAMLTPWAYIPLSSTSGAIIGLLGGPATALTCLVGGTIIGVIVKKILDKQIRHYQVVYDIAAIDKLFAKNENVIDAQAPGMPTEKDGFVPPKKWDGKKVKNPNGPGYGWQIEKEEFGFQAVLKDMVALIGM